MRNSKRFTLICLITILPLVSEAQFFSSAKQIEKNIAEVGVNLYAGKYEITNGDYLAFLESQYQSGIHPDSLELYLVDSIAWNLIGGYQAPLTEYYFRHPAFADFPVVNVSYEGALAFCRWLTIKYNSSRERKYKQVEFVLPDTIQWMQAARGGRSHAMFPWNNYYLRDKQGRYLCNMRRINELNIYRDSLDRPVFDHASEINYSGSLDDRSFYTAEVRSFYPNPFGIYNMSGNVAEMTVERGISKGGSWNSFASEIMIQSFRKYRTPNPETGFRVFMRVIRD